MTRSAKTHLADSRGAALVELALVLPLLLVVVFGMLDFGKAFNEWIDETHLANDGARLAAVSYCPDLAQADCGWAAKGCPSGAVSSGPLACIAWYTGKGANVNEIRSGRTASAYAPRMRPEFASGTRKRRTRAGQTASPPAARHPRRWSDLATVCRSSSR